MTKEYFIQLADYNVWANDIVHSWLTNITDEQWNQTVMSSFNSIAATTLHIASAESVWLDRLNNVPAPVWLSSVFNGSKDEAVAIWNKASKGIRTFLGNFDETKLPVNLAFKRLNGDAYEMPHFQVFAHLFNHSSYHRGQLVTMLRQVGFSDVGSTDMLGFFRK